MEQEKQNLLEMIDRPVFFVRDGIITEANQAAKNRQIPLGDPVESILTEHVNDYKNYQGGILYLTLQMGWVRCGAMVMRQGEEDIFLMDRDSDHTKLQALALAAQQLRIPLSDVMTLTDSLFPQLEDERQQMQAAQIRQCLFQLMRMISNMADAECYCSTEITNFENTELRHFFREILDRAQASLEITGTVLRFTCPDKPLFATIDRERMQRAVYNLLSNAVKFSPPGSTVEVRLIRSGHMVCLSVEDHGEGVADHVRSSLFHRYLREPVIEDSRYGMGLGMTLVRSVAALHGGTVLLEHTEGTRVTMTMAIRKVTPGTLRSPQIRISDYAGGQDPGLLEFSECLPTSPYEIK